MSPLPKTLHSRIFAMLLLSMLAAPSYAQYTGPIAASIATSVKAILDKPVDDQNVILKGKLIKQISLEKYVFSDGINQITADIDKDDFPLAPINENTLIEIRGEVKKDLLGAPEIDVDTVRVLK